jgi:hypothetical protein
MRPHAGCGARCPRRSRLRSSERSVRERYEEEIMHFNNPLPNYVMRTVFLSLTGAIFVFVVVLLLTALHP